MADAFTLHRRNLLKAGAIGSLAAVATKSSALAATMPEGLGSDAAALAAWIRTSPDGRILISIGQTQGGRRPGEWHTAGTIEAPAAAEAAALAPRLALTSYEARREAHAYARDLLMAVAARGWSVPHGECVTRCGRILHEATGRQIPYRLWMTL
ncbi:hypothetical protein [Jiella sp. M17.18]|uniref:hypothetical protein n=1 Tax=Jiella sp. M17.18 TaxID=3234247 RepID=UPI0034DF6F81